MGYKYTKRHRLRRSGHKSSCTICWRVENWRQSSSSPRIRRPIISIGIQDSPNNAFGGNLSYSYKGHTEFELNYINWKRDDFAIKCSWGSRNMIIELTKTNHIGCLADKKVIYAFDQNGKYKYGVGTTF